jgi:hypothetical protein
MIQVSLDTSFLISFADPSRPNHAVAVEYFRHCLAQRIPMWISTVAAGELEVKQSISDLPLQNFHILPYNLPHAIRAAALFRSLSEVKAASADDARRIIINYCTVGGRTDFNNLDRRCKYAFAHCHTPTSTECQFCSSAFAH